MSRKVRANKTKNQHRLQKKQKKQQRRKQKNHLQSLSSPRRLAQTPADVFQRAEECIDRGDYAAARELLEEQTRQGHKSPRVLRLLLDVYHELGDYQPYCRVCQELIDAEPDNFSLQLMLAGGYLGDARPASALLVFQRFIDQWPNDPLAEGVRLELDWLTPCVEEMLESSPFPANERYELAAMHEEVLSLMGENWQRTARVAEALLARCPDFIPVLNNVTQAYYQTGRVADALAAAHQVLEKDPDNVHALSNLVRILYLSNRREEALALAERLKKTRSEAPDVHVKQAEALSILGDHQGVVATLRQAEQLGVTKDKSSELALLLHMGAVALDRQSDHAAAKRYWSKALKIYPGLDLAEENLVDAKLPASERQGPWAFGIEHWLRREVLNELVSALDPDVKKDESRTEKIAKDFAKRHPEIVALVPVLLERGDPVAREFAHRFAFLLDTPEMHTALLQFAQATRGPDEMRMKTVQELDFREAMPPGPVRMWIDGQWQETQVQGYEISDEPTGPAHSPEVEKLAYQATEAIHNDDGRTAETLLRKALKIEPDMPDLHNNLAAAYQSQGKHEEAEKLAREVHARWPDYFFGRIGMANLSMDNGELDEAERYLAPLREKRRLHHTEFAMLCMANIRLYELQENFQAAESWLEMWEKVQPDHPQQKDFQSLRLLTAFEQITKKLAGKGKKKLFGKQ